MRIENDVRLDFKDVLIRPKRSTLSTRSNVDVSREFRFRHAKVDYHGVPIIAANMDTTGTMEMARALDRFALSTALHKHYEVDELVAFFAALERKSAAFYSMGITGEDYDKFRRVEARCGDAVSLVCVDVANGYTKAFVDFLHKLRAAYPNALAIERPQLAAGRGVAPGQGDHRQIATATLFADFYREMTGGGLSAEASAVLATEIEQGDREPPP